MDCSEWNLPDARNRFDELLDRAEHAPQTIKDHDRRFVVLSGDEYRRLTKTRPGLKDLILNGPSLEGVDLDRDRSPSRPCEL